MIVVVVVVAAAVVVVIVVLMCLLMLICLRVFQLFCLHFIVINILIIVNKRVYKKNAMSIV